MTRREILGTFGICAAFGYSTTQAQSNNAAVKHQAILLRLLDHGFDPPQLSHAQGLITIVVFNATRGHDISLVVEQTNGALTQGAGGGPVALANAPVARETRDYRGVFQFTPGTYVLRDSRNADWRCRLTITAN